MLNHLVTEALLARHNHEMKKEREAQERAQWRKQHKQLPKRQR